MSCILAVPIYEKERGSASTHVEAVVSDHQAVPFQYGLTFKTVLSRLSLKQLPHYRDQVHVRSGVFLGNDLPNP